MRHFSTGRFTTDTRADPRHSAPAPQPAGPTVLLVSDRDGDALRTAIVAQVGDDVRVEAARSAADAVDRLNGSQFDAIVLDLDLPDGAAFDTDDVRERTRDALLIVRGTASDAARQRLARRAHDALPAGDSAESVGACVRSALARQRLGAELERCQAELDASEARFRSIIERTADGIVIVGADERIRFVNPAAEQLFGRSAADLSGEEFGVTVVHGEAAEMDIVRHGTAEPVIAELRVSGTQWEGEAAQLIALRDVTDRRRAEERAQRLILERAAREQAERERRRADFLAEAATALDASLDAETTLLNLAQLIVPQLADWCVVDLVEHDRIRRVAGVHVNPAKQRLLDELTRRYPPTSGSPQPAARVLVSGRPELHRGITRARLRELAVDDDHASLLERLGVHSSMTVPLRAREQQLGAITFVCGERDFDEHDVDLAEEVASRAGRALENARLYEAALAANRAKADFLAVMSHELRTPLNAVLGYTELLLGGISGELGEQQTRHVSRIQASAAHLLQIIEEILTYARTETGREAAQPERTVLGQLIDQVGAIAEPLVREHGLSFEAQVDQPAATLVSDAGKLRQIMLNLLTNAVKFTDHGSVRLRATITGSELVVSVADTGIGIAPEDRERIFEPFWQAEGPLTRHAGGTGLGLGVSQRLARMLGGDITVDSQPGVGSTFTVRVPVHLPATEQKGPV